MNHKTEDRSGSFYMLCSSKVVLGYILFTICCSLFFSLSVQAQKLKDDMARINQVYEKNRNMSFHTRYSIYANYTSTVPVESSPGTVKVKGDKMYYKIGNLEIMKNTDYVFSADHDQKTLAIMSRVKGEGLTENVKPDLDKIIKLCTSITYFDAGKGIGGYEVVYPSDAFSKMRLTFDKKTFLIESVSFYYGEEQTYGVDQKSKVRIEIKYSDYKLGADFSEDAFSYSKYLTRIGNFKYTVKEPYLAYRFLNEVQPQ